MSAADDPTVPSGEPVEAIVAHDVPVTVVGRRGLRQGLRRLATGLIAYGAIGVVLSVVGLVALLYVGGRLGGLGDRIGTQVEEVARTIDDTSAVLADARTSAGSFATTLERTPPSVRQAATTIGGLREDLLRVEADLAALTVLGARPLVNVASLFGGMAADLEGLDGQLETIAADLEVNRTRLDENGASLDGLVDRLDALATDLRGSLVEDSLADVQVMVVVVAGLLLLWATLPAIGALALGLWLRRELRRPARGVAGTRP